MAVRKEATISRFIGLSTDTKPTGEPVGSTFFQYDIGVLAITYDGTNWVDKPSYAGPLKTISVTKALEAAGAYAANDVLSESDTPAAGTAWTFAAIARADGQSGYITKAEAISESEGVTPQLTLFLFNVIPTSELDDNAANTAPDSADLAKYIGRIDFPALESLGTTDSNALATPSTTGNLPLAFTCAAGADDLFGVLVTRGVFTQTATDDMTIRLTAEQY